MNVALPKPGFGKLPDRPSFDKKFLAAKTKSGTTATASQSTLKTSVSEKISNAKVSTECRTRASSSSSSTPFVAATHNMSVYDYKRDYTTTVPHGAIQGNHMLESSMGMTGRSTQRLINSYQEQQQQQQLNYLNQMNASFGNNYGVQQPQMSWSDIGTMLMSAATMVKESGLFGGAEKGGKGQSVKTASTVPSSDSNIASMQNATTSSDLSTAISGAKGKVSELDGNISGAKGEINTLKGKSSGLKSASDGAAKAVSDNKTAIQNKTGEVQNNIQRESASQMAMNAAQSQVDMLQSQLASAGPMAKAGIQLQLDSAKEQLSLKKDQYEQAVKDREQSQQDLQELKGQTQGLESKAATAKSEYETNESTIASKESDVRNFTMLKSDMNEAITQQEARLEDLKQQEEKDKK